MTCDSFFHFRAGSGGSVSIRQNFIHSGERGEYTQQIVQTLEGTSRSLMRTLWGTYTALCHPPPSLPPRVCLSGPVCLIVCLTGWLALDKKGPQVHRVGTKKIAVLNFIKRDTLRARISGQLRKRSKTREKENRSTPVLQRRRKPEYAPKCYSVSELTNETRPHLYLVVRPAVNSVHVFDSWWIQFARLPPEHCPHVMNKSLKKP